MFPRSPVLKLTKLLSTEGSRMSLQEWVNALKSGVQRPLGAVVPYPFTED